MLIAVFCTWSAQYAAEEGRSVKDRYASTSVRMSLIGLQVGKTSLELRYEIVNISTHDVWIHDNASIQGKEDLEIFLGSDNETLNVCRRVDLCTRLNPVSTYVRLREGETRAESLSLRLPIDCQRVASRGREAERPVSAKRLVVRVGYYEELPQMICGILAEAEQDDELSPDGSVILPSLGTGELDVVTLWQLNRLNKTLDSTCARIIVPYNLQKLKAECLLQITIDGLYLPYRESPEFKGKSDGYSIQAEHMGLWCNSCTRVTDLR